MDGRVLIRNGQQPALDDIPELSGWIPGPATFPATGTVHTLQPVSLVIPTFFNSELKRRSLRHLLNGLHQCECVREIILVSSDGEPQDFSDLQACAGDRPFRIVESDPHNRGRSRNVGAAAAVSPNLLFLDDDMVLRNWRGVDVVLSHLLMSGIDAALFPRRHYAKFPVLYDPPTLQQVIELWRRQGRAEGSPFLYDPVIDGARDLPMLFCFPGCFMLIRRPAFQQLRGFTEGFVGWGFEDTDFAIRAMRELNVLNLFRSGEPLLHIDHPVSPYKSDEHNVNFRRFYASAASPDMHLFCRQVFRGIDFSPADDLLTNADTWMDPLRRLVEAGIPVNVSQTSAWWLRVARRRLVSHLGPLPKFIALHGSRAEGQARLSDDYDVLSVYDGIVQEFFVSQGEARVEIECADLRRFEHIASHPAIHSFAGPMELAKMAGARLLWGDADAWAQWSSGLLRTALENGECFWLVLALGLRRHSMKYGPIVQRYIRSLHKLRTHGAGDSIDLEDDEAITLAASRALESFCPEWRDLVRAGEPVFELQVPEVWTGLLELAALPGATNAARMSRQRPRSDILAALASAEPK